MGGAEQRRAGGEDEAAVADGVDGGADIAGVDDAVPGDGVGEVGIGHVDDDAVAGTEGVDVAEGGKVGGAVPGDGSGSGDSGEAGFGEDAGALLEFGSAGPGDEDEVDPDAGDVDAPDGCTPGGVVLELAGEEGDALALGREQGEPADLKRRGRGAFDPAQGAAEAVLLEAGVERGEGLLPKEGDPGVGESEDPGEDENPGERAPSAARTPSRTPAVTTIPPRAILAGGAVEAGPGGGRAGPTETEGVGRGGGPTETRLPGGRGGREG